jgi:hypothetical protein
MSMREGLTRRRFLKRAAGAAAAPYVLTSSALGAGGRPAASSRIVMGGIGMGGQGSTDLRAFMGSPEVQVVAVCDVQADNLARIKAAVEKRYGPGCAAYGDFRDLTGRPDLDAVVIGTPDHWHAIPAIEACRRGKDVYCEKPLSLTIREGRAMVEAARRNGRVFSGGSQRVLGDHFRQHVEVRSGALGQVREVYVNVGGPARLCDLPGEMVPPGFNWDLWLGPAPWAPYHSYRCSRAYGLEGKGWRSWSDYSGGMMTDWGGHKFGAALFSLGLEREGPVEVLPPDGKNNQYLTYVFANGLRLYHVMGGTGGSITFKGTAGQSAGKRDVRADKVAIPGYKGSGGIHGDFLHCVKTRERPFRDVEISHRTATVCHLGNIAYQLGRPLRWDPVREEFPGDAEANRLLDRPKREPWRT